MYCKKFFLLFLLLGSVVNLPAAPEVPSPLQPFLLELLRQERGNWKFLNAVGQQLEHPGEVAVTVPMKAETVKTAVLRLDHPEFPGDVDHAEFQEFQPVSPGKFELRADEFTATLTLSTEHNTLSKIRIGAAVKASRIPAALFVSDGKRSVPVRFNALQLQSDRVGDVFTEKEAVTLHVLRTEGRSVEAEYIVTDHFRNREVKRGNVILSGETSQFTLPLDSFGSFAVELKLPEDTAKLRVTRIPERQELAPEASFVGMNIFQQQTRYYSYQLPLFAQAGVRWVRPWLHWENTWKMQEPKPGVFDTEQLDALRRRMKAHDQKFVYILYNFSPTLGLASTERSALNDEQMKLWKNYVRRIVAHCPEVNDWEVWNEPDLFAANGEFTADFYRRLMVDTAQAIRETQPGARVHTLSHANQIPWLREICSDTESAAITDVVTLHSYARSPAFTHTEMSRQRTLDIGGFAGKPQQFNEIGYSGHDESPSYNVAFANSTERMQAETLPINWAQALHFGGPEAKAYWFCSLDPRDPTDPEQRTWDSAFGLLYLGLQPKIAFATLAGMAKILDGSTPLGRMEIPDTQVRYVAFSDGKAIVWNDDRKNGITAIDLGCAPGEPLTVYDLFGNHVDSGKAETITLQLNDGPRYLVGSKRLGELAHAARETWMKERVRQADMERQVGMPQQLVLKSGETGTFDFAAPANSKIHWETTDDFPGKLTVRQENGRISGTVAAGNGGGGAAMFTILLPGAGSPEVRRILRVSVDRHDYIPDGTFSQMTIDEYQVVTGVFPDFIEGAKAPGSLRLHGPFAGRIHLKERPVLQPNQAIHFRVALKGKFSPDTKLSFNVAMFAKTRWVTTWMAASLRDNAPEGNRFQPFSAQIPEEFPEWTVISATLPADRLPNEELNIIFFIDAQNGKEGDYLLIDDLELYQQSSGTAVTGVPWGNWKIERKQGLRSTTGNLLLEAPTAVRLHMQTESLPRNFRFRILPQLNDAAQLKIALACFNGKEWLGDQVLAATQGDSVVRIPRSSVEWQELSGVVPALPEGVTRCLLFVDAVKGEENSRCEISPIELSY